MEDESPIRKAFRAFALADPNNCDREWEACLALTRTASISSPTNSTLSLGPAAAATASSATSAPARPREPRHTALAAIPTTPAVSRVVHSSKDDLTPEARHIYDYLVGNSAAPPLTASLPVPSSAISTKSPAVAASASTTTCISRPATTSAWAPSCGVTEDCPSLAATDASTNLGVRTELDAIQDAVDTDNTDLTAPTLTTCSGECTSCDDSVSLSVLSSLATASSSTTTYSVVPEHAAPVVTDKAVDVDITVAAPTVAFSLPGDPNHSNGGAEPLAMPLTPWSAPQSFNVPLEDSPSLPHEPMVVLEVFTLSPSTCSRKYSGCSIDTPPRQLTEAHMVFNFVPPWSAFVPWPPPRPPVIHGQDSLYNAQHKCGKDYLVVWELDSRFARTMEDVTCNQGKQGSAWPEVRNDRHLFERMEVVKLKPPWPPFLGVCMNMPMADEHEVFMGMYSFSTGNTILLLPWDPGLPSSGRNILFITLVDALAVRLSSSSEVTCLQGNSLHELFSCSFVDELIKNGMVELKELQPWTARECVLLLQPKPPWYNLLHAFNSMELQQTKILCFHLLLKWPGVLISTTASFYGTLQITKLFLGANISSLNCQNSTKLLNPSCWNGWHSLSSLIHWLHVPCVQLFWGLLCAVQGHDCSSTSVFLSNLNGESEVQHQYTYSKGWIYHLIQRGNTHYSELLHGTFSHSLLQSEFRFCTTGHIIFFCCALEQWEIPWTISLVPPKFWFQCCRAQCDCLYSYENFQWTIAWSLSPSSLSTSWSFSCSPWEDWLLSCSTRRVLQSSSEKCQLEIAGLLGLASTEWKPWIPGLYLWAIYFGASACGRDIPTLWWLQFAIKNSLASQEEFYCSITIENLHDLLVELGICSGSVHCLQVHYSCDQFVAEALHLPWDPGDFFASAWSQGSFSRVDDGFYCPRIDTSQVSWDPGGLSRDRLGGKPNFKRGGLSTTCLHSLLGWLGGPPPWAWPAREMDDKGNMKDIYASRAARGRWLGRNGLVAASAEAWLDA